MTGLTAKEARRRLLADGPNELPSARPTSLARQVWEVVRQPMLLLLLGAGAITFVLSEPLDAAVLLSFVLVVIGISIYQARKTENALTALRDLSSPRALVLRDGHEVRIAGPEVVRGDVVVLGEGDRVPADGTLADAVNLHVDESTLTGEAVPVRKQAALPGTDEAMGAPGGDGTPWVFAGTLVVKGRGHAVIRATGNATELGRIGTALRTIGTERTPLQREVARLVRYLATLGLVAALVVVVVFALTRRTWLEGLLAGVATAMAMLPEEFPVVLTVFLALGAWRMAQKHVLTRRPAAIEALGSASVICVDKTGTLTMNAMTVDELIVEGHRHTVDHGPLPGIFRELAEYSVLASPPASIDPMDQAFQALGDTHLAGATGLHRHWVLVREYPLSERCLALTHVWQVPGDDVLVVAAKGAPEAVANLCRLSTADRGRLTSQVEQEAATGHRVLAVAGARVPASLELPVEPDAFEFAYLGLVGLHDPVRPGVGQAVAELERAGVRTVMITGDYAGTALAVAREIGITHDGDCITGPELAAMDDAELALRAPRVSVFARMVPDQKLRLVRALQADGQVVGMTGDGVNDAPALRAADIGIAMGARGTDVAREAAALVITDDDYGSITAGVRQGRGIFANLRKAMAYIVAVHVPIVGISLVPVFVADWPLVLLPALIAFLELIIDPACSIVFEAEQIDPAIMEEPPRRADEPALGRWALVLATLQGLSVLAAVLAVYVWGLTTGHPDDEVRSMTFVGLVVGNLALILVNRSWRLPVWRTFRERNNRALGWILVGAPVLLALLLSVPWLRTAFDLEPLSALDAIVAVVAGVVGVAWFEVYKVVRGRSR